MEAYNYFCHYFKVSYTKPVKSSVENDKVSLIHLHQTKPSTFQLTFSTKVTQENQWHLLPDFTDHKYYVITILAQEFSRHPNPHSAKATEPETTYWLTNNTSFALLDPPLLFYLSQSTEPVNRSFVNRIFSLKVSKTCQNIWHKFCFVTHPNDAIFVWKSLRNHQDVSVRYVFVNRQFLETHAINTCFFQICLLVHSCNCLRICQEIANHE